MSSPASSPVPQDLQIPMQMKILTNSQPFNTFQYIQQQQQHQQLHQQQQQQTSYIPSISYTTIQNQQQPQNLPIYAQNQMLTPPPPPPLLPTPAPNPSYELTRDQRVERVISVLKQKIPRLNLIKDLTTHGGLSFLSKLMTSQSVFNKITNTQNRSYSNQTLEDIELNNSEEEKQQNNAQSIQVQQPQAIATTNKRLVKKKKRDDIQQDRFSQQQDQNYYLRLKHSKRNKIIGHKRPQAITVQSINSLFESSQDKIIQSIQNNANSITSINTNSIKQVSTSKLFENIMRSHLDLIIPSSISLLMIQKRQQSSKTSSQQEDDLTIIPFRQEQMNQMRNLMSFNCKRKKFTRSQLSNKSKIIVNNLDQSDNYLIQRLRVLFTHHTDEYFQLIKFWLLYQFTLSGESSQQYNLLHSRILKEVQICFSSQSNNDRRSIAFNDKSNTRSQQIISKMNLWIEFLHLLPTHTLDIINHIRNICNLINSLSSYNVKTIFNGPKLCVSLLYQKNSKLRSRFEKHVTEHFNELVQLTLTKMNQISVAGALGQQQLKPQDQIDKDAAQFYLLLYIRLCEYKLPLVIQLLYSCEPNFWTEYSDILKVQVSNFLKIKSKQDAQSGTKLTSQSPQIMELMKIFAKLGQNKDALIKKKNIIRILTKKFAEYQDIVPLSNTFCVAVQSISNLIGSIDLIFPIYHKLDFAQVGGIMNKVMLGIAGIDGKPQSIKAGCDMLLKLFKNNSRKSSDVIEIFRFIILLEMQQVGKNTQNMVQFYTTVIKPQVISAKYICQALKQVLSRKELGIPNLVLYVLQTVRQNYQHSNQQIQGVLKKLIEKNIFDYPSLWNSFCEMIVKHPNKFIPVLRYAPNLVRKKFFDIHPNLLMLYKQYDGTGSKKYNSSSLVGGVYGKKSK